MKFSKKKHGLTLEDFFEANFGHASLWEYMADDVDLLAELIAYIRPKKEKDFNKANLSELISLLHENENYRNGLSLYLRMLLKEKKFSKILTDAGILADTDFFYEVKKRLLAKLIPDQPTKNMLEYVLNQVFFNKNDPEWVNALPKQQLGELMGLLKFQPLYVSDAEGSNLAELIFSMEVIIHRIAGRAMESEVIQMVPEYENLESPFLALQKEFALVADKIMGKGENFVKTSDLGYKQLKMLHRQCTDYVRTAFRNSDKFGISLRVNQNLLRIRQQLERLGMLLPLLAVNEPVEANLNSIKLGLSLIEYNCKKTNVRKLISESTQLLSYEVTQHTAKTGEHYITRDRREYLRMFWAASGGGIIVGILCIIKVFLSKMETSAFGHAFFYSLNYSLGFITIYVLGFTLATKQPAMTAAALVSALEKGRKNTGVPDEEKHYAFAEFFARVFRSQFIAFVGNVLVAFPVALLGIWGIDMLFDYNIAERKWPTLILDLSPVHSLAMLHAAIAGIFLFLSGIIAGSIANRDKHRNMYYRIEEHPFLKRTFGKTKAKKLSQWYEKRWAGIVSNFWFGVFMGSTASVGIFLGLNLDIRHITFASGNLALGLYGGNYGVSDEMLFWGILGVGIIGLINFLVSFGLSMVLAFRSRNIPLSELRLISWSLWNHFKYRPGSFFFPNFTRPSSSYKD